MEHTNEIAIRVLTGEYGDYPRNAWHYDRQYNNIVTAIELAIDKHAIESSIKIKNYDEVIRQRDEAISLLNKAVDINTLNK